MRCRLYNYLDERFSMNNCINVFMTSVRLNVKQETVGHFNGIPPHVIHFENRGLFQKGSFLNLARLFLVGLTLSH